MAVTIYSNFDKPCAVSETQQIVQRLQISEIKSCLFVILSGPITSFIVSLSDCLQTNNNNDYVVCVFPYEAPDYYKCITHLEQLVTKVYKKKFAFIDYGADIGLNNHFTFNNFVNETHPSWVPFDVEQRTYKWVCANRVLKPHRINFLHQLLTFKGEDKIVTAGNFVIHQKFNKLCNFNLPIQAPDEPYILNNDFESTRTIPDSFRKSVFNLVTESSYENIGDVFDTWSRVMITEKTTKAYRCYQLPIFLAPAGHVQLQRKLGFDLFDDIIDHSYDFCDDPIKRIELVINECKKINQHDLNFWKNILNKNWDRLHQNNLNCDVAKTQIENSSIQKFHHWINH